MRFRADGVKRIWEMKAAKRRFFLQARIVFPPGVKLYAGGMDLDARKWDRLMESMERTLRQMQQLRLDEYLRYAGNWKRRLAGELLGGLLRGIGFSIGFTLFSAMIVLLLRNMAMANLPVIGRFLAEVVRIVERNL